MCTDKANAVIVTVLKYGANQSMRMLVLLTTSVVQSHSRQYGTSNHNELNVLHATVRFNQSHTVVLVVERKVMESVDAPAVVVSFCFATMPHLTAVISIVHEPPARLPRTYSSVFVVVYPDVVTYVVVSCAAAPPSVIASSTQFQGEPPQSVAFHSVSVSDVGLRV